MSWLFSLQQGSKHCNAFKDTYFASLHFQSTLSTVMLWNEFAWKGKCLDKCGRNNVLNEMQARAKPQHRTSFAKFVLCHCVHFNLNFNLNQQFMFRHVKACQETLAGFHWLQTAIYAWNVLEALSDAVWSGWAQDKLKLIDWLNCCHLMSTRFSIFAKSAGIQAPGRKSSRSFGSGTEQCACWPWVNVCKCTETLHLEASHWFLLYAVHGKIRRCPGNFFQYWILFCL